MNPVDLGKRRFLLFGCALVGSAVIPGLSPAYADGRKVDTLQSAEASLGYSDYDGWILTADEKPAVLDNEVTDRATTVLHGVELPHERDPFLVTDNWFECEKQCLLTPGCASFTYAQPDHPQVQERSKCWLSTSADLPRKANEYFISGVR